NVPVTYDDTKPFAHALAQLLERRHPELVVSSMAKDLRRGKVLIDWSQNDPHKTTVCVYSLRARPRPTVSTPVSWDEVEAAAGGGPRGLVGAVVLAASIDGRRARERLVCGAGAGLVLYGVGWWWMSEFSAPGYALAIIVESGILATALLVVRPGRLWALPAA